MLSVIAEIAGDDILDRMLPQLPPGYNLLFGRSKPACGCRATAVSRLPRPGTADDDTREGALGGPPVGLQAVIATAQVVDLPGRAYTSDMSNDKVYLPGEVVPESGMYECDTACGHSWSTDVQGDRFPPTPEDCSGSGWNLATTTPVGQ